MSEWFIMVALASRIMFVGPFGEAECHLTKQMMFNGASSVCIERSMISDKRRV